MSRGTAKVLAAILGNLALMPYSAEVENQKIMFMERKSLLLTNGFNGPMPKYFKRNQQKLRTLKRARS